MTEIATPFEFHLQNGSSSSIHDNNKNDCKLYLHTGNIANWSNLRSRKANDIPANELYQSLSRALEKWRGSNTQVVLQNSNESYINCSNADKLDENERGLLKITAKIFLQKLSVNSVKEAVDFTLTQLGLRYIDSLYLALPPCEQSEFTEMILPFWEELERLRDAGIATQISSCDLDDKKLKALVDMVRTKPEVNQVNLTSCCHMPESLVKYAKEVGVVLHTHGDQSVMLPNESLDQLIHTVQPNDTRSYTTNWVVRYAIVVKCRGVIKSKGYIVSIDGNNEKEETDD